MLRQSAAWMAFKARHPRSFQSRPLLRAPRLAPGPAALTGCRGGCGSRRASPRPGLPLLGISDRRSSAAAGVRSGFGGRSSAYNSDMADTHLLALAVGFRGVCRAMPMLLILIPFFGRCDRKVAEQDWDRGLSSSLNPIRSYSVDRAGHRVKGGGVTSRSTISNLSLSTIGVVFPGGGRSILISPLVKSRAYHRPRFPWYGSLTR